MTSDHCREFREAHRTSRMIVGTLALAILAAGCIKRVEEVLTPPDISVGARKITVMMEIEEIEKPKPEPKPEPVPEPPAPKPVENHQEAVPEVGTSSVAGSEVTKTSASQAGQDRQKATLAYIVGVIEANKRYPRRARQNGIEGTVTLSVVIGSTGRISAIDVENAHKSVMLNKAALNAADKLLGAVIEGQGAARFTVAVVFSLFE